MIDLKWDDIIPTRQIAEIVADMYAADTPRSVVIEELQELYRKNGSHFFDSQLSWFRLLTKRKTY